MSEQPIATLFLVWGLGAAMSIGVSMLAAAFLVGLGNLLARRRMSAAKGMNRSVPSGRRWASF